MDTVLLLGLGKLSILRVSKVTKKKQTNAKKRHLLGKLYACKRNKITTLINEYI